MNADQEGPNVKLAPALAAATLAVATFALPAAASPHDSSEAAKCGYFTKNIGAYYDHCTSDGSSVVIVVQKKSSDEERCVKPGVTYLGSIYQIRGAYYNGKLC
ncbi:DUF6355 family natural product biosynthesis protein [Allokutzneria oryzae]|uniref:DUF6355 family natural product biosynthesis protein n=1 Tax=Allokutzneria oryzae TaxID=1378989 RepID=A0ABV5ZTK8_9PSEU